MNAHSRAALFASLLIVSAQALATKPDPAPKPPATAGNSHAESQSISGASAVGVGIGKGGNADASSSSHATGGSSRSVAEGGKGGNAVATGTGGTGGSAHAQQEQTATGGTGGDGGTANADANNTGNAQQITYHQPRQVPPVLLSSLMVSDCGAGANAGAADTGGAGALGIVWTPKRCYALRSAINFFAIGEYETGCELLLYVNREALKAIKAQPDCGLIAERLNEEARLQAEISTAPATQPQIDLSKYATKDELDRAFKQSQKK